MSTMAKAAGLLLRDSAVFSPCGIYRFKLCRDLGDMSRRVCFIMLNPSKAGATINDPTVRRDMSFVHRWGYGWLDVVNMFPLRSTDPKLLWKALEPTDVQLHNLATIIETAEKAQLVVAAWGSQDHHLFRDRRDHVVERLRHAAVALHCLGTTKDGNPRHPLYVPADQPPVPWSLP